MALLNLGKNKEQAPTEAEQQEVPEELPDLPEDTSAQADAQDAGADAPDELPGVPQEAGLAPDELPPIDGSADTALDSGAEMGITQAEVGDVDRRSYFSDLLQKLNDEGLKSTKLTAPSANLLTDMKKYWKEKKKEERLGAMNAELVENLAPLQKLEQEWAALQDDIESKKQQLKEKEQKIQELAENLKSLARKTDSAHKK